MNDNPWERAAVRGHRLLWLVFLLGLISFACQQVTIARLRSDLAACRKGSLMKKSIYVSAEGVDAETVGLEHHVTGGRFLPPKKRAERGPL